MATIKFTTKEGKDVDFQDDACKEVTFALRNGETYTMDQPEVSRFFGIREQERKIMDKHIETMGRIAAAGAEAQEQNVKRDSEISRKFAR